MTPDIIEAYRPLYNEILEKPFIILGIFQEQFGEENVELQGIKSLEEAAEYWNSYYDSPEETREHLTEETRAESIKKQWFGMPDRNICIIVHFPNVRVTNENDKYIDITHLWARVTVTIEGTTCGRFSLLRSEYTKGHWLSDYAHSHIAGVTTRFKEPCTGAGPINATITTCASSFQEDFWRLYCYELSLYVKVESLAGVPYRKLEKVTSRENNITYIRESSVKQIVCDVLPASGSMFKDFLTYALKKKSLKFNFNGAYGIAMSYKEERVFWSNLFIEWYNLPNNPWKTIISLEYLLHNNILQYVKINGSNIDVRVVSNANTRNERNISEIRNQEGKDLFTFKGEIVKLHFIADTNINDNDNTSLIESNHSILLEQHITQKLSTIILRLINGKYNQPDDSTSRGCQTEATAQAPRNVIFL